MADIIIKGMEMPKGENAYVDLQVWGDGKVYKRRGLAGKLVQEGTAVPLPEKHGRLIDEDALRHYLQDVYHGAISDSELKVYEVIGLLYDAPTIIEAEGGEDG